MNPIRLAAALTVAAVLSLPAAAHAAGYADAVLAQNPLSYLRLEETTGTIADDASPNGRDGVYVNAVLGATGPFAQAGSAVALDSSSSVTATVGAPTRSVELWVNPARLARGGQEGFVAHGDPSGDGWALGIGAKRKLVLVVGGKVIASRLSLPVNRWTMVAVAWDATKAHFYANGGSTTKDAAMGGAALPASSSGAIQIGGSGFGTFGGAFAGSLDEVSLFDHVLTAADVQAHFTASGVPASTAAPIVTGTPKVAELLSVAAGAWTGAGALAYQWQRCDASGEDCEDVTGATTTSHLLGTDDVGSTLRVVETASNANGSASTVSEASAVVEGVPPAASDPGVSPDPGANDSALTSADSPLTSADPASTGGAAAVPVVSTAATAPAACLRLVSRARVVRVGRVGRVRLRIARDGCVSRRAPLRVAFRARKGTRIRSVAYRLGKRRLRTGARPRHATSLTTPVLRPGRHTLTVRVTAAGGRVSTGRLSLRLRIG